MKEITRIHLAALPYNVEIVAKKELEKYLNEIQTSLSADDDTMREIESRFAELLAERGVHGEKVITQADVAGVMAQLGSPRDFAGDDAVASESVDAGKRVMRDPANAVFGGVCAGLAAYWGFDVVWMRLAFIVLTFMTGGAMIPVYIAVWLIMPAARTAGERLQMAGKPVTLENLQQEAGDDSRSSEAARNVKAALRIGAGIIILLAGLGTLLALALATWQGYEYILEDRSIDVIIAAVAMGIAGVLFVTFCLVTAAALLTNKFSKKLGIILATLAFLGVLAVSIGGLNLTSHDRRTMQEMSQSVVEQRVDASALAGAKKLVLSPKIPMTVNYNYYQTDTTSAPIGGTLWYNTKSVTSKPIVKFTREGDTVTIDVDKRKESDCLPDATECRMQLTLTLEGPMLESIIVGNSSLVRYNTDTQAALSTETRADGRVELQTIGSIETLTATIANESRLSATQANVENVVLTVADPLSNAEFAKVKTMTITAPESCAKTNGRGVVSVDSAQHVQVNGREHDDDAKYPCTIVRVDDDWDD